MSKKRQDTIRELITTLNKKLGLPTEAWTRRETDNRLVGNVGCVIGDYNPTYGGWRLAYIMNETGGEGDLSGWGRLSHNEAEFVLRAYLAAIRTCQNSVFRPINTEDPNQNKLAMLRDMSL